VILDSSALLAIVLAEPEEPVMASALLDAPKVRMSAVNWVESAVVVDQRRNPVATARLEEVLRVLRVEVVPVTASTASIARLAYQQFGRGNHKAKLNFADTFAYALAKESREPLLFKGNDFSQTDIEPALKA
jgi:ribonuclease VapC